MVDIRVKNNLCMIFIIEKNSFILRLINDNSLLSNVRRLKLYRKMYETEELMIVVQNKLIEKGLIGPDETIKLIACHDIILDNIPRNHYVIQCSKTERKFFLKLQKRWIISYIAMNTFSRFIKMEITYCRMYLFLHFHFITICFLLRII